MEEANLPEEIVGHILTFLPVKPLIRFTCVSKRFHSLILSDPKFARSQFQAARDRKTLTQRLLCSSSVRMTDLGVGFLDLDSPLSVTKLELPFRPASGVAEPLGSCNGIVFLSFDDNELYLCSPSTGFFKKLPDPKYGNELVAFGVGYLPATDEYKVFTVFVDCLVQLPMGVPFTRPDLTPGQQSRTITMSSPFSRVRGFFRMRHFIGSITGVMLGLMAIVQYWLLIWLSGRATSSGQCRCRGFLMMTEVALIATILVFLMEDVCLLPDICYLLLTGFMYGS